MIYNFSIKKIINNLEKTFHFKFWNCSKDEQEEAKKMARLFIDDCHTIDKNYHQREVVMKNLREFKEWIKR